MDDNRDRDLQFTPAVFVAMLKGDLDNALIAATPGGIEAQEKQGQETLVNSSILPIEAPWEKLEAIGFVRGKDVDDLFCEATLPAGWRKVATEHSMHSDVVDDRGRKRGGIFYKAAFYDRSAYLSLVRRFYYDCVPVGGWDNKTNDRYGAVMDQGVIIWHTDEIVDKGDYEAKDALRSAARKWLEEHYPDHDNPLAYWD